MRHSYKTANYLVAALFLLLTGCKDKDELLTFYVEDQENIYIESSGSILNALLPIQPVPVTTNSSAEFSQNNTHAGKVKNVLLDRLTLTITDPAGETFSFLQKLEIFISAGNSDEVKLAYLNDVPANAGNSIQLTTSAEKLDKYLKADSYTIRTVATTDEAVNQNITIRAEMRFKVTADPL